MNREIEFRGKTKDNEWIYGYYYKETSTSLALQEYGIGEINTHYIFTVINHFPFKVEVVGETIGQYTGLKDKNGKKIFEGDIVSYIAGTPDGNSIEVDKETVTFDYGQLLQLTYADDLEIIGNIYENNLESKGE